MAYQPGCTVAEWFAEFGENDFHCSACKWLGKGKDAMVPVDDLVRCPNCAAPVERPLSAR